MAKRRARRFDEKAPEDLTPDERREKRRRERATREKRGKKGTATGTRRVAVIGGAAAVVVAVVVILVVLHPFGVPCLSFTANPSGTPAFPPHNTTDFTGTWCPSGASAAIQVFPHLQIVINGKSVNLPSSIGRNSSYRLGGNPYECDLPITTTPASAGLAPGTIDLASPWPYLYNLSDFFSVWAQSYSSVNVNQSNPSQPIVYTANDLLGFTADSSHAVALTVDGQLSTSGPSLTLNTLDDSPAPYPSCLGEVYGTGHTIVLSYGARGVAATPAPGAGHEGVVGTVLHPIDASLRELGFLSGAEGGTLTDASFGLVSLGWLTLRSVR